MYCPSCGAESTQGLKYCKRCGNSLNLMANGSSRGLKPPKFTGMYWAIGVTTIGGLSALTVAVIAMVALGMREGEALLGMMVFGCLTIFGIVALLIRQLSRLISTTQLTNLVAQDKKPSTSEYGPPQITAPPIIMSSVTENTTRRFGKSHSEETEVSE